MRLWKISKLCVGTSVLTFAAMSAACTEQPATTNTNTPAPNVNAAATTNANAVPASVDVGIDTREPDKYRATYVLSAQTTGTQTTGATFNIEVARNGADRRYAFNLPQPAGQIIFLDKADKRYLILQSQKRYMELTPEMTGFEVPRAMTPGMMVEELKKQQGVTRVGEEQMNNRTVIKYRYAATANTNSQAGEIKGETFVYIDKETGLPMRVEAASAATGNVQGVSGGTARMELRDIQTEVEPTLFEIPAGVNKVSEQEMKQYQAMLGTALQMLMSNMGGSMSSRVNAPTPSPAATTSPVPAPTSR